MSIIYYIAIWVITGFIFGALVMKSGTKRNGALDLREAIPLLGFFLIFGAILVLLLPFLYIMKIVGVKLK